MTAAAGPYAVKQQPQKSQAVILRAHGGMCKGAFRGMQRLVAAACSAGQVPGDAGQVRGRVDRGREEHFLEKTFQNTFSVPVVSVNEGGGERF